MLWAELNLSLIETKLNEEYRIVTSFRALNSITEFSPTISILPD